MRRHTIALALALSLCAAPVLAQSTATPVVTGYLTTSNCPYGQTTCFVQFGTGGGGVGQAITNTGFAATDASGTVTSGGAYQTLFAASATRHGCSIQNPTTATEVLNVRISGATVYTLSPGAGIICGFPGGVVTSLVEVTAATTSHAFSAASE